MTVVRRIKEILRDKAISDRICEYPACDHLNIAILHLLNEDAKIEAAIEEICLAIEKSGGYFYGVVEEELEVRGIRKKK